MIEVGLFQSIRSTIKYQSKKANVVADAFNMSQQKSEEDSTYDLATIVAIEEQMLAPSGISVELTMEDLQQWTMAYKEDKSCIAACSKLCQG